MLGEHTDEVLSQLLGLGAEQVAALRTAGVIGPNR
jgi:crotonobetainyl-CoA:carnitine CoA-transferase CaiB-like acyl-CoA transferase